MKNLNIFKTDRLVSKLFLFNKHDLYENLYILLNKKIFNLNYKLYYF